MMALRPFPGPNSKIFLFCITMVLFQAWYIRKFFGLSEALSLLSIALVKYYVFYNNQDTVCVFFS